MKGIENTGDEWRAVRDPAQTAVTATATAATNNHNNRDDHQ
jgi:hypothetical protein